MTKIANSFQDAQSAFLKLKQQGNQERNNFLEEIARQIEIVKEELIPIASEESNLPEGRITGELGRTLGQIRLFADLVKEGSWVEAVIDNDDPERTPAPKPDVRRMLRPLGPVVVFGASNFPLAFSTAGGDTISALASGCPVLYKAHPAHPQTSKMVAKAIQTAVANCNMPEGTFQHIEGGIETGQELVAHPLAKAVAFTGSFKGGKALFDICNKREQPIPVYAEMGSVNPVFAMEAYLNENLVSAAAAYANSLVLGAGQFCTNPGLIFIPKSHEKVFSSQLLNKLEEYIGAPMLHEGICNSYHQSLKDLATSDKLEWLLTTEANQLLIGNPSLAKVKASDWLNEEAFQEEVFGPFAIMVVYDSVKELERVAVKLKGQLTCTVWGSPKELLGNKSFLNLLEERCGRMLFKGVPTGVEVGHAMHHGGPYPSTTDSRSTSVGSFAIKRFTRPVAFQDMPDELLPKELKNKNPLQILRMVDGEFLR